MSMILNHDCEQNENNRKYSGNRFDQMDENDPAKIKNDPVKIENYAIKK